MRDDTVRDEVLGAVTGRQSNDDVTNKASILAVQSQLEAYKAKKGAYPSQQELNSPAWRKANMPELAEDKLVPLGSKLKTFADKANKNQFGYIATSCDDKTKKCQNYALSALLTTGIPYTRTALN